MLETGEYAHMLYRDWDIGVTAREESVMEAKGKEYARMTNWNMEDNSMYPDAEPLKLKGWSKMREGSKKDQIIMDELNQDMRMAKARRTPAQKMFDQALINAVCYGSVTMEVTANPDCTVDVKVVD